MTDYEKGGGKMDDWEEKVLRFCEKAIIPVAILWGVTGIIDVIVNALGL